MVDGTLYFSTPAGSVIALDPETGAELWKFDARVDPKLRFGDHASRGVATWLDAAARPNAPCRRRIIFASVDARPFSLDARSGAPCAMFGTGGSVNLRVGLRNAPFEVSEYVETSPPAIVNGLIVVGSAIADNNRRDAASGEVRALDVRTGELKWT